MTLSIDHPFWLALFLIVPVSIASGVIVHRRSVRLANALGGSSALDAKRGEGSFAFAVLCTAAGTLLTLAYVWFGARFPSLAPWAFVGAGVVVAAGLSLVALRLTVRSRLAGTRELVALNVLWALTYGVLVPALLRAAGGFG